MEPRTSSLRPCEAASWKDLAGAADAAGRDEEDDALDEKNLGEAVDDGAGERLKVGLRGEAAAELDERLAVVVALLVEDAVDAALDGGLDGVEDEGGGDDDGEDAPGFEAGQAGVCDLAREGHDHEVHTDESGGGEGVGHAALEDEVGIHEPVADDGPGKGEWQEDEAEADDLGDREGDRQVEQVGNRVQHREGQHGQQGSAGQPFQLLAFQHLAGAAIAEPEDHGRYDVRRSRSRRRRSGRGGGAGARWRSTV